MDIAEYEKESPVLSREEAKLKGLEREGIGRVRKRRTLIGVASPGSINASFNCVWRP